MSNNNVAHNICKFFNNFKLNDFLLKVDYCQEDIQFKNILIKTTKVFVGGLPKN